MIDTIVKIAQIVAAGVSVVYFVVVYFYASRKNASRKELPCVPCEKCKNLNIKHTNKEIKKSNLALCKYECKITGNFDYSPEYCKWFVEREEK